MSENKEMKVFEMQMMDILKPFDLDYEVKSDGIYASCYTNLAFTIWQNARHNEAPTGEYILADDVNRLTKDIDIAINGKNAAEQASLCDIAAQVSLMARQLDIPIYDALNIKANSPKPTGKSPAPYGYCPKCGAKGISREKRINGNDRCENDCSYPSATALTTPKSTSRTQELIKDIHNLPRAVNLNDNAEIIKILGVFQNIIIRAEAQLTAQADEIKRLREGLEWQPIETAPKDETEILVYCKLTNEFLVSFFKEDNWIFCETDTTLHGCLPDYWQPLPDAPKQLLNNEGV
jgi:hypothetical protein